MVRAELVEVDGAIRLVQRIRPVCAAIVGETGGYADACAGKEEGFARAIAGSRSAVRMARSWQGRREEFHKRGNSAGRAVRARGDYRGRGERVGEWDAQERGTNGGHCWGAGRAGIVVVTCCAVPMWLRRGGRLQPIEAELVIDMASFRES